MSFSQPWWLLGLLLIVPMTMSYLSPQKKVTIAHSHVQILKNFSSLKNILLSHLIFALRCLALISFIFALARPQTGRGEIKQRSEGLDIMLVLDTSGSMKGLDFELAGERQTRMDVVKSVIAEFIQKRTDDRLGMVVFGTNAFSQAPLTLDHDVLLRFLEAVEIGMAGDQTAIGDGMAVAINRLKEIEAKNKIIILLTDGENTAGQVNPREMIKVAKLKNVKVYTIGVGSNGEVPIQTRFGVQHVKMGLDEKLLQEIAEETGGKYYLAQNTEKLKEVYETIDKLEKTQTEIQVFHNYEEQYAKFVIFGLICLLLEMLASLSKIRRIPS